MCLYSPKIRYCLPWCTIEIHSIKDLPVQDYIRTILIELNKKLIKNLPDMKVSAVEYAIDVFCNNY